MTAPDHPPITVVVPPCPFCGAGSGWRKAVHLDSGSWAIQCIACGALGPPAETGSAARKAWSTRIVRPGAAS